MNCQRARSAISLYLDERLNPQRQTRLNRHLENCEDCSSYLEDLRAGLSELRSMPMAEPSANFEWNLRRRLAEAETEQKLLAKHAARSAFWPRFALSAAATIALCVAATAFWFSGLNELTPATERPAFVQSDEEGDSSPQRLPEGMSSRSIGVTVGGAEPRSSILDGPSTIKPADPNLRFPLRQNSQVESPLVSPDSSASPTP